MFQRSFSCQGVSLHREELGAELSLLTPSGGTDPHEFQTMKIASLNTDDCNTVSDRPSLFPVPVGVEVVCYGRFRWCDGWLPQQLMNLILAMRQTASLHYLD